MKKQILSIFVAAAVAFSASAKSLVVYFSVPESTKTTGLTRTPTDHAALLDRAMKEKRADARPKISGRIENLAGYDTVFVGYPNWNADLPPILYSFFDDYDLSGKRVIPFCTHGGSGLSRTVQTIARLEPQADVEKNAFTESRDTVDSCKSRVIAWLGKIGVKK